MSIKTRKHKIIILLLFLTLFVGLDVYGQSNEVKQRASKGMKSSMKNPFTPLTAKRVKVKAVKKASQVSGTPQVKVEPGPVVRLTATFTATNPRKRKSTAMIEENGVSRFVSVGDKIMGMTIAEIQRGKVILNRGGKKCLVKLGLLPEEIASNGP